MMIKNVIHIFQTSLYWISATAPRSYIPKATSVPPGFIPTTTNVQYVYGTSTSSPSAFGLTDMSILLLLLLVVVKANRW